MGIFMEVHDDDLNEKGICMLHDRWSKSVNVGGGVEKQIS